MERTPLYLDFYSGTVTEVSAGDSLPMSNYQLPIGYVLMNTTNINPNTTLGYGTWTARGNVSSGVVIYYFERTA